MPQQSEWSDEDGVVLGRSICRGDDPATALDAQTRKALNNLTSPKVENHKFISPTSTWVPALLLARKSDKSDKIQPIYMWSGNSLFRLSACRTACRIREREFLDCV